MERVKIEKNRDYTILSNIGLRDKNLSLKAKGFYAVIFSLSDNWDFSISGICSILKESKTAVYSVIKELQQYGYCKIERCKDEKGKFIGIDYSFIECPYSNYPQMENPKVDNPQMGSVPQQSTNSNQVPKQSSTKLVMPSDFKLYDEVCSYFDKKYINNKWIGIYDKLIRIDGYSEKEILEIVKEFRRDGNWWKDNGNFLSLAKLREVDKKNNIKYIDIFKEKMPHNKSGNLGLGEYYNANGERTYGQGQAIVPKDAPPRPSEQYIWSKNEAKWKIQ